MGKARFGEMIKEARVDARLSLREVAAKTGIEFTRLSRIEHGSRPAPGLSEIRILADLLNLDMVDLLVAAGTSREVMEYLLWSERLHVAETHPNVRPYRPDGSLLLSKNTFHVQVLEREGARCKVALGKELLTVLSFSTAKTLSIEISPEAILIAPEESPPVLCSAENAFPMRIKKARRLGQVTNLVLAGQGFELNTLHTTEKIDAMCLVEGTRVFALVQATAIRTSPITKE
jgi:transcriptional regulator with XRE-family HTH domain/molybdopterin-binding protein